MKSARNPLNCYVIMECILCLGPKNDTERARPRAITRYPLSAIPPGNTERVEHLMSATSVQSQPLVADMRENPPGINDFSIVVATVNGSGSQTANSSLLRALFKMGIPVCGKNLFPSNIQGLPTWFTIRISKQGFVARRDNSEVLVALNRNTAA